MKRYWLRLANPARRLAVTWRYGGSAAALDLIRQRYRELRPPPLESDSSPDAPQALAARATTLPAAPRRPLTGAPAVSVIVRTHDRPALLEQALTSLANQTFADFEVVLVNDGELDIAPVIERLAPYIAIRQADHIPGRGRTAALNSGLAAAHGRWITYLDDDDIVYPMHLERLVAALEDGQAQVAYVDANRALCWSGPAGDEALVRMEGASLEFDFRRLLVDNWIPNMAFMHTADCAQTVGCFDEAFDLCEDWDFLIRLGQACAFRHITKTTCEYRYRFGLPESESRNAERLREAVLRATQQIYARYPAPDGEVQARRRLTLAALQQDIEEARRIEQAVADPLQRDLLLAAHTGRFPVSRDLLRRYAAAPS